jgi:hypothetical protein
MKTAVVLSLSLLMVPVASFSAPAATKIKIASVPAQYTPKAGAELPESISMEGFRFEVNNTKTRARIVVDYTYPDEPAFGADGGLGPQPTFAQLPGLDYDRETHQVVYKGDGASTVCADVTEHRSRLRPHFSVRSTGACVVTAVTGDHAEDTGWDVQHAQTVDTYFEVHEVPQQQASIAQPARPGSVR